MFCRKIFHKVVVSNIKPSCAYSSKNPAARTWETFSEELTHFFKRSTRPISHIEHADIVIIGGGFIGSSVAYWLKTRAGEGLSVVVLEKDFSYSNSQNIISLGTISQHYSLPENIELAQYGAEFLRNSKEYLGDDVNIKYKPCGHLTLACEKYADRLEHNVTLLAEQGYKSELISKEEINRRFPWINTNDIVLGCIGRESEGVFDSWEYLSGLIKKCKELGTIYLNAEVIGFEMENQHDMLMEGVAQGSFEKVTHVNYKLKGEDEVRSIKFAASILSAGVNTVPIAEKAYVGTGDHLLQIALPIATRKSTVYSIENIISTTGLDTPIVLDTSGIWVRRVDFENSFQCALVPLMTIDESSMTEDEYYNNIIKPSIINRFPEWESASIKPITSEYFDCNTFDNTGFLGPHPYHNNLYIAAGFGYQGCRHAIGLGRGIAELIIDGKFTSIDLTRFGFDRLLTKEPTVEFNIY